MRQCARDLHSDFEILCKMRSCARERHSVFEGLCKMRNVSVSECKLLRDCGNVTESNTETMRDIARYGTAVNIMLMRPAPLVGRAGGISEGRASEGGKKEKKSPACVQYHTK